MEGCPEPGLSVLWPDRWQEFCDRLFQRLSSSCSGCAEHLFELGPCFFDGVEIGRVRGQVEQFGSGSLDSFSHAGHLVRAEIVHDHHMARSQHGAENVIEISEENFRVCRRLDGHRGDHAA